MSEFWYCLKHHAVEGKDGCKNADRLGPYDSEAEAARALEKIQERNEEWDNDPKWNDEPSRTEPPDRPARRESGRVGVRAERSRAIRSLRLPARRRPAAVDVLAVHVAVGPAEAVRAPDLHHRV